MKWSLTVGELLNLLEEMEPEGGFDGEIKGIADIRKATRGDLSFVVGNRFEKFLTSTKASVVLVPRDQKGKPSEGQLWIRVKDPSLALGTICQHLELKMRPRREAGIHPTAIISPEAEIHPSVMVGPYCIVEAGAHIGENVVLESHVKVEERAQIGSGSYLYHGVYVGWDCRIGRNCTLFQGAVVGADGFGFHSDENGHRRLAQIGCVVIEDDVELGANSAIDRARFAETRIGQGTKIDNLVQIAHNVTIGRHCIICSGVGIAGSVEIGNFVVFAGQVGVSGHLRIGDGVTATGQTGITKDVPPGTVLSGMPARPHREEMRKLALLNRLPSVLDRLKALEEKSCK